MNPHAIPLRKTCALPERFELRQGKFCENWNLVEGLTVFELDVKIRGAGWHFMWTEGSCCRRGCGWAEDKAVYQALKRALNETSEQFSASELDSIVVKKYSGFFLAKAILHPRLIQQLTSLDMPNA